VEFICDVDWMKRYGVRGVVIGRKIMFAQPAKEIPQWCFRHELEHAYQQIRDGRITFYLKYFYYSLRYGYEDNPYEVEARERSTLPLTENEVEIAWKLRNGSMPQQDD